MQVNYITNEDIITQVLNDTWTQSFANVIQNFAILNPNTISLGPANIGVRITSDRTVLNQYNNQSYNYKISILIDHRNHSYNENHLNLHNSIGMVKVNHPDIAFPLEIHPTKGTINIHSCTLIGLNNNNINPIAWLDNNNNTINFWSQIDQVVLNNIYIKLYGYQAMIDHYIS